jgi:hypothetical protein
MAAPMMSKILEKYNRKCEQIEDNLQHSNMYRHFELDFGTQRDIHISTTVKNPNTDYSYHLITGIKVSSIKNIVLYMLA